MYLWLMSDDGTLSFFIMFDFLLFGHSIFILCTCLARHVTSLCLLQYVKCIISCSVVLALSHLFLHIYDERSFISASYPYLFKEKLLCLFSIFSTYNHTDTQQRTNDPRIILLYPPFSPSQYPHSPRIKHYPNSNMFPHLSNPEAAPASS
jgi:hypothetical protein